MAILIIGSGVAGLYLALEASKKQKVILATKSKLIDSNTYHAQGGLAAVFGKDDETKLHIQDTLRAGDGLSNKKTATILAVESPKIIQQLEKYGMVFNTKDNKLKLSREAVHSRARIVHSKDTTGKELAKTLISQIKSNNNIEILENHFAYELIIKNKSCKGAKFLHNNKSITIKTNKTVLTTGGIGRIYSETTNPEIATGDGIAMAFNAGAMLEDMEFVQFHPTMLYGSNPTFLISETLRGEGGILKNTSGKSYMKKYHRDGDLAPRDVVSKFSLIEMRKTLSPYLFLDMTHFEKSYLKKRFPNIFNKCLEYGIDISLDMIPITPSAHYICGGIKVDKQGKTTLKNLFSLGECSSTQIHGADRLASNSMTEGMVFATKIPIKKSNKNPEKFTEDIKLSKITNGRIDRIKKSIQNLMWKNVGIIRTKKGLKTALEKIDKFQNKLTQIKEQGINREIIELENILLVSKIITISAIRRKESRGTHFIEDYPDRHDNIWKKHLIIDKKHPLLE